MSEGFYSDPLIIKEKIIAIEDKFSDFHPEEKYRYTYIYKPGFPIKDYIDFKVSTKSNTTISLKTYMNIPDTIKFPKPRGIVYMFHGMGAFTDITTNAAEIFLSVGLIAVGYDYRGHGYSEGEGGLVENMDDVIDDSKKFIVKTNDYIKTKYPDDYTNILNNKFVTGISMGGFMSYFVTYQNQSEYRGVVYFCPAVGSSLGLIKRTALSFVSFAFPSMNIPKPKESQISKNPYIFENPHPIISKTTVKLRTVNEILSKQPIIQKTVSSYETPFLIIIPGIDKLVSPLSQYEFYEKAKSSDKEVWYYENCWHAIYIEEEMNDIIKRLPAWIEKRIVWKEIKLKNDK